MDVSNVDLLICVSAHSDLKLNIVPMKPKLPALLSAIALLVGQTNVGRAATLALPVIFDGQVILSGEIPGQTGIINISLDTAFAFQPRPDPFTIFLVENITASNGSTAQVRDSLVSSGCFPIGGCITTEKVLSDTILFAAANTPLTLDISSLVHLEAMTSVTGSLVLNFPDGLTPSVTPLPAALPLYATGLAAAGLIAWRRKRKQAAALAPD